MTQPLHFAARSLSRLGTLAIFLTPIGLQAQGGTLSMTGGGGALPGTTVFALEGPPGADYLLLPAVSEASTPIPGLGITLEIPLDLLGPAFQLPNFFGTLDTNGQATNVPNLPLPDLPALEGVTFSLQALFDDSGMFSVSNLVRLTPQVVGTFRPSLDAPSIPIAGGAIAAIDNDEFVFFGGSGPAAQTYSSRLEEWSLSGGTTEFGLFAQATSLADGRVLLTGGIDPATGQPTSAASIFDPQTQMSTTLSMAAARAGHAASRLQDGRVLITGGVGSLSLTTDILALFSGVLGSAEIFDPTTDSFGAGPTLIEPRAFHTSTTTSNGRVLIAGGISLLPFVGVPTVSATSYLFNPANGSFGLPSFFSGGRFLHSAVALDDGRVALIGGLSVDLTTFLTSGDIADLGIGTQTDCQVFSEGFFGGSFATVEGLQTGRAGSTVTALPGGRALIAGGFELTIDLATQTFGVGATATADIFDGTSDSITATGSMASPRFLGLAQPLPDGTVLIVGGGAGSEIYQPN